MRLRDAVAGRTPLPARGLRGPAQHPYDRGALGPRDAPAQDRLRLQHHADVAPAAAGRGFRDRRHPDEGAHRVRRRPRLPHPRGRDLRRADDGPGRQPRAVRGAGRDPLQGVQRGVLLAQGHALHAAAGGAVPRLRPEGDHAGAAPRQPAGRVLAAGGERQPARPRLHDPPRHQGRGRRRRGHHVRRPDPGLPRRRRAGRPGAGAGRGPDGRPLRPYRRHAGEGGWPRSSRSTRSM